MAYRTIFVSLNNVDHAPVVLEAAMTIARTNSAYLIGLFVIPGIQVYPAIAMQVTPDVLESQRDYYRQQGKKAEAVFREHTEGRDIKAEWHTIDAQAGYVADVIVDCARCAELLVTGQADSETDIVDEPDLAERLLMESGRPVLLMPASAREAPKAIGERVTIAWSRSRESARAVYDALPFLEAAKAVKVLCVNPAKAGGAEDAVPGSRISASLARHGIKAEVHNSANTTFGVGAEILSKAAALGTDLLVMGGYGHSRMREFVFGGATRHILRNMKTPVLMSH